MPNHRLHDRCACGSELASTHAWALPKGFVLAGTQRAYERDRPFAIKHIALDLVLDPPQSSLSGTARLRLERRDIEAEALVLDAVDFEMLGVERVKSGGKPIALPYDYDGASLRVRLPKSFATGEIQVRYRATPSRGMYFLAPDAHVRDRPRQVWTQNQDEDARYWIPCHDKPHQKQTTEIRVKVPVGWSVLSNGEQVSRASDHKKGLFHWKQDEPHASYLMTLVAGEFSVIEARVPRASKPPLSVSYWVPKGREDDGARTFGRTPEMIANFEKLIGVPYAYSKYAQVVVSDFIFGGMENTSATTMYEYVLIDKRGAIDITSDDIIAHELAHQWFGDLVTCRDWSHGWLNEGFATFFEHVDLEMHLGLDEYHQSVEGDLQSYLTEAKTRYKRPIVCADYENPIDVFDRHLYEKGGLTLHVLRHRLGGDVFWSGVKKYLNAHAHTVVETRDLMRALEEASGRSLEKFFEQHVYRPGHVELKVTQKRTDDGIEITVEQRQSTNLGAAGPSGEAQGTPIFQLELAFAFGLAPRTARGKRQVVVEKRTIRDARNTLLFRFPRAVEYVVVDPDLAVLGDIQIEAPKEGLLTQLEHAPTARGRRQAARMLAKFPAADVVSALERCLGNDDEFWATRAAAAGALGSIRTPLAFDALKRSAKLSHPKVRRAVVMALGQFRSDDAVKVLKPIALKDRSYLVEAAATRALGNTRRAAAFDTLVELLDRPSWADVVRIAAAEGLAALRDERAVPHLLARTRYGVPMRARRAAIVAAAKLSSDRKTRERLESLLDAENLLVRVDVVKALSEIGDTRSRGPLQRQLSRERDGRVRRRIREVLRDLGGSSRKETERLRDEVGTLKREGKALSARLEALENASAKGSSRRSSSRR